jgi:hypothetical protein
MCASPSAETISLKIDDLADPRQPWVALRRACLHPRNDRSRQPPKRRLIEPQFAPCPDDSEGRPQAQLVALAARSVRELAPPAPVAFRVSSWQVSAALLDIMKER